MPGCIRRLSNGGVRSANDYLVRSCDYFGHQSSEEPLLKFLETLRQTLTEPGGGDFGVHLDHGSDFILRLLLLYFNEPLQIVAFRENRIQLLAKKVTSIVPSDYATLRSRPARLSLSFMTYRASHANIRNVLLSDASRPCPSKFWLAPLNLV